EVRLAQALEAKEEQERQAQHLKELRQAQTAKLADLRNQIESSREEATTIQARSEEIAQQLAANALASVPSETPNAPASLSSATVETSGFAWPINGAITSGFGARWGGTHSGLDIDCVTGDAIRASRSGLVVSATYDGGYGYHVVIDHGGGFASLYAHASKLYVSGGQSVTQGDAIAACGSTGQSTGDHLHFEIRVNGTPQDPLGYLP
ncbi:MAG: peptidoglycan DD-metalloendopeptidase family protein, partial [Actinobacteria bacterium]|nr:peptidoglycan DD-metalloendopeptidase family protein [Actinomycetota bacterium]